MKITFIGGGNMAVALIGGLHKQGFSMAGIQVVDPVEASRERLTNGFGVRSTETFDTAALNCEVLVLAVKPQQMKEALAPCAGKLGNQLVISIAAGLRIDDMARWLGGHRRLVRTMPNTPALIGAGITGLFADPSVDHESRAIAERILSAVGRTVWIEDEARMDAVTAVSGSGPAYVFYFIEALEDAACKLGMDPAQARLFATETFWGGAKLASESTDTAAELRAKVTSKRGTTERAIESFDQSGVKQEVITGVLAACARAKELGDEMAVNLGGPPP